MKSKLIWGIGVLLVFCLMGCTGGATSALVGKWVEEHGEVEMQLFKDGSGTFKDGDDEYKGTWTANENGQLTLKLDDETETFNYKISGNVLTLNDEMKLTKK